MRGKASVHVQPQAEPGIIPVGAGKSSGRPPQTPSPRDHPRGCGEKRPRTGGAGRSAGSSPRVRGEAARTAEEVDAARIIPAGAGRSSPPPSRPPAKRDHPRGCGEKGVALWTAFERWGSSPRVRGERRDSHRAGRLIGIIPAGAGRSELKEAGRELGEDHPRGCGEKSFFHALMVPETGSSPRVRGEEARKR